MFILSQLEDETCHIRYVNETTLPSLVWILTNFNTKKLETILPHASYIYFKAYALTP